MLGLLLELLRIAAAQTHLFEDHLHMLEETKTMCGARNLVICWANRSWTMVVAEILADLSDPRVLRKCGLMKAAEGEEAQHRRAQDRHAFVKLTVQAAAQRSWSMTTWSELPPNSWSRLLSSDQETALGALAEMQEEQEMVDAAIAIVQSVGPHPGKEAGNY